MSKQLSDFANVIELNEYFKDDLKCRKYLEKILWDGKPVCPHCGEEKIFRFSDGKRFKCATCRKQFTVTVGTFLESSKIPLCKWLHAIFIFTSHKKGISSHQLAKDLGISQKSSWFVLSRIREILKEKAPQLLEGTVQIDATMVGGKIKNKSKAKRKAIREKFVGKVDGAYDKSTVLSIIANGVTVQNHIIAGENSESVLPIMRGIVKEGSTIVTDESSAYKTLKDKYVHISVNHSQDQYVKNGFTTNNVEGYFSHLKRGIYGIYHQTSKQHLHRYCHEFAFRYNYRKLNEVQRFDKAIKQAFGRLKYIDLIKREEPKPVTEKVKPMPKTKEQLRAWGMMGNAMRWNKQPNTDNPNTPSS